LTEDEASTKGCLPPSPRGSPAAAGVLGPIRCGSRTLTEYPSSLSGFRTNTRCDGINADRRSPIRLVSGSGSSQAIRCAQAIDVLVGDGVAELHGDQGRIAALRSTTPDVSHWAGISPWARCLRPGAADHARPGALRAGCRSDHTQGQWALLNNELLEEGQDSDRRGAYLGRAVEDHGAAVLTAAAVVLTLLWRRPAVRAAVSPPSIRVAMVAEACCGEH
jgi:hypothetical protein